MNRVAPGSMVRSTNEVDAPCGFPRCVMTTGRVRGRPSSPLKVTLTPFCAVDRFNRVRLVFQTPPDAI